MTQSHVVIVFPGFRVRIDLPGFLRGVINGNFGPSGNILRCEERKSVYLLVLTVKHDGKNPAIRAARVVHKARRSSEVQAVDVVHVFFVKPIQAENIGRGTFSCKFPTFQLGLCDDFAKIKIDKLAFHDVLRGAQA
jgi:hypothetical protein